MTTTPEYSAVSVAVRVADVRWLSAYFDGASGSRAALRSLLRAEDPRVRHLGVEVLCERAATRPDAESAALLPASIEGPAETALVLARAYERLRAFVRPGAWPRWRAADLPARVRIGWLRAEIVHRPGTALRVEGLGEELYQAVDGIGAADVDDVDTYLRALIGRRDPVLSAAALRVLRAGLHEALLDPERAGEHLVRLLDPAGGRAVVAGALGELAEPWAAVARIADVPVRGLAGEYPAEVLDVAVRHGDLALLRDFAGDAHVPGALRQRATAAIGEFATRGDVGELLRIGGTDPLLSAGSVIAALGALHRRGHFVAVEHAPAVVDLALADHRVSANDVAIVLFTVRDAALRALVDAPAGDPGWPRRVELLVALAGQGAADLPVGAALTARLAMAARPEPFLDGLRELRHEAAEGAVLAELPRAPQAALRAIEAIGGIASVAALREGLGLTEPGGVIAPHLRGVPHDALGVLWHLTQVPEQRRELLDRLDVRDLPGRIAADLGAPASRELALLGAHPDPDEPVEALCRLARNGDAHTLPVIADLLLRVVGGLVASRGEEIAQPVVPAEVVTAIGDLGERLHRRGALRPVCLLDAADPRAARDVLVASIVLDLVDRPDVTDAELAVLLALLVDVAPYRRTKARTHRLLRHRDPHVRKHAIALLVRDAGRAGARVTARGCDRDEDAHREDAEREGRADRTDARALSASLIPLTAAADPQTVRQALRALGHARARWAGEAVGACLDHPVMNIKKTAADALVHTGTPAQVPALLGWLGRRDNPGLRTSLIAALRAILGDAYAAVVVSAAERAQDGRVIALSAEALDGALSARAVGALAARESPLAGPVLRRVARGAFTLSGGTIDELTHRFAAYGIVPPEEPADADEAELRADLATLGHPPARP
ncbi:HEAT repeat domain-containing protein, partial [Streptomyces sp. SID3343]|uniref:HEAT repeat domain-containing protein n=1 Tax=Streptomyces sp. SID3343 TaxID=2690260 RepID=UPI0013714DCB